MAGNDQIIFKGQVYGNTISTDNTIVLTAPNHIDPEGVELYTIELPDEIDTVEIEGGGRVTYGTSDLQTVVCQGLKMTKGAPIDAFLKGMLKPTDLYTSINLKTCFTHEPIISEGLANQKYIAENYDLEVTYSNINGNSENIYFSFIPTDVIADISEHYNLFIQDSNIESQYNTIFGEEWSSPRYLWENFPFTYKNALEASQFQRDNGICYHKPIGFSDYFGLYFQIEGISRAEADTLYIWNDVSHKYTTTPVEGYAIVKPYLVGLRTHVNSLPSIYIPADYTLPSASRECNVRDKGIISIKNGNNRTFYTYYNKFNKFMPFDITDLNNDGFYYFGDVSSVPATGNTVTINNFSSSDTINSILHQMFNGIDITIYQDPDYQKQGDLKLELIDGQYTYITTYNNIERLYTEKDNDNNFIVYCLICYDENPHNFYCAFKNNAELNFSLGVREKLRYISKEEYDSYINNGDNSND